EEVHDGEEVLVTRKGAIRAGLGDLGIIPGSMGTRSYIVRGRGNAESFESASHGAGRRMSRTAAKRRFSLADLREQTAGVECRKDHGVLDEIPGAYKRIDQVMANQSDLVEIVAELKQLLCIKGCNSILPPSSAASPPASQHTQCADQRFELAERAAGSFEPRHIFAQSQPLEIAVGDVVRILVDRPATGFVGIGIVLGDPPRKAD